VPPAGTDGVHCAPPRVLLSPCSRLALALECTCLPIPAASKGTSNRTERWPPTETASTTHHRAHAAHAGDGGEWGDPGRSWRIEGWGMGQGPRWQFGLGRQNGLAFWALLLLEGSFASYILFWPLYIAQLGANPAQVGIVIGAQGLLRLAFLIPSGWLVDRLPAVPLIVAARALG